LAVTQLKPDKTEEDFGGRPNLVKIKADLWSLLAMHIL